MVVALYRRLEQLGYEVNRCLWWWPSTGDSNNYSTLIYFFLSTKISIFFLKNKCQQLRSVTPLTEWKQLGLLKHETRVKVEATYRRLEELGVLCFDAVLP